MVKLKVINKSVCTDDFGELVYQCHYSGKYISSSEAHIVSATIPGVKGCYVIHNSSKIIDVSQRKWFHESEKNCNTCLHLKRIPHEKCKSGHLTGICKITDSVIKFHPDDCMHKPCYVSRFSD